MTRITVVNGPNLNLLGSREPQIYGSMTMAQLEEMMHAHAATRGVTLQWVQSNHEGELVDLIQSLPKLADGAIINLGAYTHTSLALRDALLAAPIPFVEVHLSNLYKREAERQRSLTADLAIGIIAGLGTQGYQLALDGLLQNLKRDR